MPKIDIIMQPFGENLAEKLAGFLESGNYSHLSIAVAFAKTSGIAQLADPLHSFRRQGGTSDFYVGLDLGGTSYEAATELFSLADNLYLVHSNGYQTFHPKIYNFVGERESVIISGSHNLTDGGLCSNAESCMLASLSLENAEDAAVQSKLDSYLAAIRADPDICLEVTSKSQLDLLSFQKLLPAEALAKPSKAQDEETQVQSSSSPFSGHFGNVKRTRSRRSTTPWHASAKSADKFQEQASFIWIETGAGTGGSNNQLDLSMRAVIAPGDPGNESGDRRVTTSGSVEFFGIDPRAWDTEANLTIEYEGKDYSGNVIKIYGKQANKKKPNGTWRLYLAGSCGKDKLSASLREGLSNKLAVFTRLGDQKFRMELLSLDKKPEFVEKSRIVAHNGNAVKNRAFGLVDAHQENNVSHS